MNYDLLIKNGNIIDPSQNINKVSDLAIKDGKIADIQDVIDYKLAKEVIDAKGKIDSPGLIDLHVHSFWGGSISPSRGASAAAGGANWRERNRVIRFKRR